MYEVRLFTPQEAKEKTRSRKHKFCADCKDDGQTTDSIVVVLWMDRYLWKGMCEEHFLDWRKLAALAEPWLMKVQIVDD